MTIGANSSPMAGRVKGAKVTSRLVKDRLDRELVGNVSIRVLPTERPDTWEVQGRGELALAILVETMRREGFELTVGKPQVVTRMMDGKLHEPFEHLTIDAPEDYLGAVTQLLAVRKGRMEQMVNHGTGWVRMEFVVPSRGLIGFRTEFLTETRGTGIAPPRLRRLRAVGGELRTRPPARWSPTGPARRPSFAITNLQERGTLFVEPTTEVYEGMIVGENSRADDMDVNITKEKKLTNMRSSTPTSSSAWCRPASSRWSSAWSSAATTSASRSRPRPFGSARSSCPRWNGRSCGPGPSAAVDGLPRGSRRRWQAEWRHDRGVRTPHAPGARPSR